MSVELKRRKISSEAYSLMFREGIFTKEDKLELLDGEIIEMEPVGKLHIGVIIWLTRFFVKNLPEEVLVSVQSSVKISEYSSPQPDLVLAPFVADFYRDSIPDPKDLIMVIEVAKSSLAKDQKIKLPLYAKAEIATYWIVNLPARQVEVYTQPKGNSYTLKRIYTYEDLVPLPQFGLNLSVKEMLG